MYQIVGVASSKIIANSAVLVKFLSMANVTHPMNSYVWMENHKMEFVLIIAPEDALAVQELQIAVCNVHRITH